MKPFWLVTGAGSGVGRTLAVALASAGAEVGLVARSVVALNDTARWCASSVTLPTDLSDLDAVQTLARRVKDHLAGRPLAGIVHAAGVLTWSSPLVGRWSRVPLVNAVAPWRLTLALEASLAPDARVLFVAGAPFTLRGVKPRLAAWTQASDHGGPTLALEAAVAKIWMARALHRRWPGRSVFAFHPGLIKSHLADGLPFPLNTLGCLAQGLMAARCLTGEFLALDPEATSLSGALVAGRRGLTDFPPPSDGEEAWLSQLSD